MGITASAPNQYWHLDVTVIKLLDGTKVYLHGVIDSFSRRLLAWRLAIELSPDTTCEVLLEAGRAVVGCKAPQNVVTNSGVENVNKKVDELQKKGIINRIFALVEVDYSNSKIEAFLRSLRHTERRLALKRQACPPGATATAHVTRRWRSCWSD